MLNLNGNNSVHLQTPKKALVLSITFLIIAAMIIPAAMAATLSVVEVVLGVPNDPVTVEQGGTTTFSVRISANGNLDNRFTSSAPCTATTTDFYEVTGSSVTPNTDASHLHTVSFWASSTSTPSGQSAVTWTGYDSPYVVSVTVSAASTAAIGSHHVDIYVTVYNPPISDPKSDLGTSAYPMTVVVVAPSTTPLSITAPADITVEGNTIEGAIGVDLGTPSASGGTPPYTFSNDAPTTFPLGTTTVTWTVEDDVGDTDTDTQGVTVVDTTPPVITAPADVNIEGNTRNGANVVLSDLNGPATATDIVDASPTITNDFVADFYALGSTTTVTWTATDHSGNSASSTQTFTIVDTTPPTVTAPADITVEGNTLNGAEIADMGTATATDVVWGSLTPNNDHPSTFYDLGTTTVTWSATDGSGNTGTATQAVTVVDTTPPTIAILYGLDPLLDLGVYQIGKSLTFSASDIVWGTVPCSATLNGGPISSGFTPTEADVYTLIVTATDGSGNTATETRMFVIYDPSAGFVTGGGWIYSEAGSYLLDTSLEGKATFGFVSKYQKGATVPTGNTEFQFHVAGMNFKSTSYEWLVVAGSKAMYKGVGTINGLGEYKFLLTAIDGGSGKNAQPDKFRIKIWYTDEQGIDHTVYDNKMGAPDYGDDATTISSGSIVVHSK